MFVYIITICIHYELHTVTCSSSSLRMSETELALWGRTRLWTSSRTAEGSTEDISSKVCCSCWCGVEFLLAVMREQLPTKGSQASSSCCCRTLGRDTCGDSSVSALISHVEGVCAGLAEQRQEGLIMATFPSSLLFSLPKLEVTAGQLWEMAVAQVRHKFSSLVWFSSGFSVWDSSVKQLFCSVLGFISLGWTVRKHFFVYGIYAAFVEVNGSISAAGTLKVMNEVKTPQTSWAVVTIEFSYSPLSLQTNRCTESLPHQQIWHRRTRNTVLVIIHSTTSGNNKNITAIKQAL